MIRWFQKISLFFLLFLPCAVTSAHVPNALGFKTQEQIEAGLEVLTASSSQTYIHNQADQILDVYHNAPGMTVVPWYDSNGNITQVVHTVQIEAGPPLVFTSSYTYDFDNRLIAVESPLLVATYSYDGLGNLLQIVETGTVRRIVRDRADGLTRPLLLTDESGNLVQAYLWANGSLVAQVESGGAIHYAHFNELGHLLALTDENGAVTDQFAYHPYGRLVARTGTTDTPFAYMGAHGVMRAGYDLYLTRHRAYSANLMRFIQSDPLGLDGGLNLYAYAGGNPVFFVDALGLHKAESSGLRTAASIGVGFIPFVGTGQSVVELISGHDYITGNDASRAWAGIGVAASLLPAGKGILNSLSKADEALALGQGAVRSGSVVKDTQKLYHYTGANPNKIASEGLLPGGSKKVFTTPDGGLSPLQAQIDLALPPNRGLPNHLLEIDIPTLRKMGVEIPQSGQVGRMFNMPGGGAEVVFPYAIPPEAIRVVR